MQKLSRQNPSEILLRQMFVLGLTFCRLIYAKVLSLKQNGQADVSLRKTATKHLLEKQYIKVDIKKPNALS